MVYRSKLAKLVELFLNVFCIKFSFIFCPQIYIVKMSFVLSSVNVNYTFWISLNIKKTCGRFVGIIDKAMYQIRSLWARILCCNKEEINGFCFYLCRSSTVSSSTNRCMIKCRNPKGVCNTLACLNFAKTLPCHLPEVQCIIVVMDWSVNTK